MANMKRFAIYKAGSTLERVINATCVTKACQLFIDTLDRPCGAAYHVDNPEHARIGYLDNHSIMSDYVVSRLW